MAKIVHLQLFTKEIRFAVFLHRRKYNFSSSDLQLDVPILFDYIWTETSNGLALFTERELTLVHVLVLPVNVSN